MRITNNFQTADKAYMLDYILCSMPAWQQKKNLSTEWKNAKAKKDAIK